jgi:hypothetical protein
MIPEPGALDRTTKIEIDEGRASSWQEAEAIVAGYRLAVDVGPGIEATRTGQAALVTILNTATRAFKGGVQVRSAGDPTFALPWHEGRRLSEVIADIDGVSLVNDLADVPRLVVGDAGTARGGDLYPTWKGWATGVVTDPVDRLGESQENELAGIFAGALAVSERFQTMRGSVRAGRRSIGISLWRPDIDWRDDAARGPNLRWLPTRYWLAGLGHLGQAYGWAIGCLPYADPDHVDVLLQDIDVVEGANIATGLLATMSDEHELKTRVVSRKLTRLGFRTRIVERLFDATTRRRTVPPAEPGVLFTGFHDRADRRLLDDRGFDLTVDGGIGRGRDYLAVRIHRFPSHLRADDVFVESAPDTGDGLLVQPAYQAALAERVAAGHAEEEARCGLIEVAGRTVGAAFVGAAAGTLVVADAIRELHGGRRYAMLDIDLRSPTHLQAVVDHGEGGAINPGYTTRLRR